MLNRDEKSLGDVCPKRDDPILGAESNCGQQDGKGQINLTDRTLHPDAPASDVSTVNDAEERKELPDLLAQTMLGAVAAPEDEKPAANSPNFAQNQTLAPGSSPGPQASLFPRIRGYQIERELGRGGMGVVFQARDSRLGRRVALKTVLFGASASAEHKARFRKEASAVAKLRHPNIVQIYEIGESETMQYLALEFVEGRPLDDMPDSEFQSGRWIAELIAKLAGAVQHSHDHQVIHRDLKPANILVTNDDEPKLTDFGLAKALNEDSSETRSGAILGTPSFMSPEQAAGSTKQIGFAADIYGLGATMYYLLTRRPPFREQTVHETLQQVINAVPVAPRRLVPSVDRDLETITLKCLEKSPEARYSAARDLQQDLTRYLAGEPILARPAGKPEIILRWIHRNRLLAAFLLTAGLLLALLSIGGPIIAFRQSQLRLTALSERSDAIQSRKRAQNQEASARAARQAMQEQLYGVSLSNGLTHLTDRDLSTSLLWLAKALELDPELSADRVQRQRFRIDQVMSETPSLSKMFFIDSPHVSLVEFLSESQEILAVDSKGIGRFWNAVTGQPLTASLQHDGRVLHHALSMDKSVLAVSVSYKSPLLRPGQMAGRLYLWDLKNKKALTEALPLEVETAALHVTENGERVLIVNQENVFEIRDTATGSVQSTGSKLNGQVIQVAPNESGDRFSFLLEDGTAEIWSLEPPEREHHIDRRDENIRVRAVLPDGNGALGELGTGTVVAFSIDPQSSFATLAECRAPISAIRMNPDGTVLVVLTEDWTAWLIRRGTGNSVVLPLPHKGLVTDAWIGDDRVMTTSRDRSLRVWSINSGEQLSPPMLHNYPVSDFAVSPSMDVVTACGIGLPVSTERSIVRLWNTTRSPRRTVHCDPEDHVVTAIPLHKGRMLTVGWTENPRTGVFQEWDLESGQRLSRNFVYAWGEKRVIPFDVLPDAGLLATFGGDNHLRLFELTGNRDPRRADVAFGIPQFVRFSPDGLRLLTVTRGTLIQIWDTETLTPLGSEITTDFPVADVAFSSDGNQIYLACPPGGVRIFDPRAFALRPFHNSSSFARNINSAHARSVWTSDVSLIEASFPPRSLSELRIWDLDENRPPDPGVLISGSVYTQVRCCVALNRLLTVSDSQTAGLWDLTTGKEVGVPLRVSGQISDAAFCPRRKLVSTVARSPDGGFYVIWDALTGERLSPENLLPKPCTSVAFSLSGHELILVLEDGSVVVRNLQIAEDSDGKLRHTAELLSSSRIDQTGTVTPLSVNALESYWNLQEEDQTPDPAAESEQAPD
jgi:serine/threonine protein kinase